MIDDNSAACGDPVAKSPVRRVIQWFRGTDVAERTHAAVQETTEISALHLQRARLAIELADRALDHFEPLPTGPAPAVAISMLREAVYWALTARRPAGQSESLATAFDAADRDLVTHAAGYDGAVETIRTALVERTFVETADLPTKVLEAEARRVRTFAGALVASLEEPSPFVRTVIVKRRARLALVIAVLSGLLFLVLQISKKPDLAARKTWLASSKSACDVTFGYCSGKFVELLFHTNEDDSPWAELDLGSSKSFTSIQINNREDCCKERAVPLVVQVSNDRESWKELGRQTTEFDVWNLTFPVETARYLRVMVERRSLLHLKSVSVR